ncbi:Patatin-like phospholipase [Aureococcus anophagefferens]|uniref:Patatin-like phospholipase n=1 Tax=Aureococcus anophagefferens TaxID=44056 RepID=A0ABR1FK89_AURAN
MDEMDDETEDKKMLNREAMMHNMSAIDGCRSYLTIFAGVGAGILGLTSVRALRLHGLLRRHLPRAPRRDEGDSMAYTNEAIPNHVIGGVGKYGLSFVLFWTLSYAPRRNHTSLAETVSALTTELLNGFRNEDSDEVEYKSVTYNPIDLGKRLVTEYGLFKGQRLEEHIEALLFQATGVAHVTFRQLRELRPDVALRLTAASITHQRVTYFDVVATPDLAIARAVRASSAVPLLFAPVEIDGEAFCGRAGC